MAVNQYVGLQWNQPQSLFVPRPFNELAMVGDTTQRRYNQRQDEMLNILGKQVNALPKDQDYVRQEKAKIESEIGDWSDKDFSNPHTQATWNRRKMELANRFGPNGDLGTIQNNYNAYKDYEKHIVDKAKDLGWSEDELRGHLAKHKYNFSTIDPNQDHFNYFEGKGIANYVDPNEWASKALKDVADDTGISQLKRYGSLNEVTDAFVHGELNHKDYNKIVNALSRRAMGDSKLISSLEQQGIFRGQQGWSNFIKGQDKQGNVVLDTNTPFGSILSGVGQGAQYQKEKLDYMQVKDPLALHRAIKKADQEVVAQPGMSTLDLEKGDLGMPQELKGLLNKDGYFDISKYSPDQIEGMGMFGAPNISDSGLGLRDKLKPGSAINKNTAQSIGAWTKETADKFGIKPNQGENTQDFINRVIKTSTAYSYLLNKGVSIDMDIKGRMKEDLVGKNGQNFLLNFDDITPVGTKDKMDAGEWLKNNKVDIKTISPQEVNYSNNKGNIVFTALDDKGNPVHFYANPKGMNVKYHTGALSKVISNLNSYISGKSDVKSEKRTTTIDGESYTFDKVGDEQYDPSTGKFLVAGMHSLDNDSKIPVVVYGHRENGQFIPEGVKTSDKMRIENTADLQNSNLFEPYRRKIKDKSNVEFSSEGEQ